jgi:hypothetical protein
MPFRILPEIILNAARAAFLPEPEKARLISWFEEALPKSMAPLTHYHGGTLTPKKEQLLTR